MDRRRPGPSRRFRRPTARLLGLLEALHAWGPLARTQLLRVLAILVPDLVRGQSAERLRRRELARLREAAFLGERFLADGEPVFWITTRGEDYLAGAGRLDERRGEVAHRYFAVPAHNRLLKGVAVTLLEARHRADLAPRIERFAWEDAITWTVEHPENPAVRFDLEPDAVVWVAIAGTPGVALWVVEADTGEERLPKWIEKVEKYRAWAAMLRDGRFALPFEVEPHAVRVLVVTPNGRRLVRLQAATAEVLGEAGPTFLFAVPSAWSVDTFWDSVWVPAGAERPAPVATVSLQASVPTEAGRAR